MMLVDFEEVLDYAMEELNLSCNEAHDILVNGKAYQGTIDKDFMNGEYYFSTEESCKILKGFANKYKLEDFFIKPKNSDVM